MARQSSEGDPLEFPMLALPPGRKITQGCTGIRREVCFQTGSTSQMAIVAPPSTDIWIPGRRREPPTLKVKRAAEATTGCGIGSRSDIANRRKHRIYILSQSQPR